MAWPSRCNAGPACFAARPHAGAAGCSAPQRHRAASAMPLCPPQALCPGDRKSTRLNSSHTVISYAVFCLKKKEHTSELQSHSDLVCRLLLEKKKKHMLLYL